MAKSLKNVKSLNLFAERVKLMVKGNKAELGGEIQCVGGIQDFDKSAINQNVFYCI